jgi:hypothetical protein
MFSRYRARLIALFKKIHDLRSDPVGRRNLALTIQVELLRQVGRAERNIRRLRAKNKVQAAALARRGLDKVQSEQIKQIRLANPERVKSYQALLEIYRSIGDAIAFIYIDRLDVKPLALRQGAGLISRKRGTRLELAVLRRVFALGGVAILNDITNSLNYGDVTLCLPSGAFHIVEVKSGRGGSRSRAARQENAIREIMEYLVTDSRQLPDGLRQQRRAVNEVPVFLVDAINRMLSAVPSGGFLREEVEPGLHYAVIDGQCEAPIGIILDGLTRTASPPLIQFSNEFKHDSIAYYPFLLSIRHPELAFRFYAGDLLIIVAVDMDFVAREMAMHDLRFQIADDRGVAWQTEWIDGTVPTPQPNRIGIGAHLVGRLGAEFLSLNWLLNHIVHQRRSLTNGTLVIPDDENLLE